MKTKIIHHLDMWLCESTNFVIWIHVVTVLLKIASTFPAWSELCMKMINSCGRRMSPAIAVNKGCCGLQDVSHAAPSPNSAPWGETGWRRTGYWPKVAKVHIKEMISVSPDAHIPIHRKALKFINLRHLFFSLISSNLLMFSYLFCFLFCKNSIYPGSSLTSLE